jgi:hypothetical protein
MLHYTVNLTPKSTELAPAINAGAERAFGQPPVKGGICLALLMG